MFQDGFEYGRRRRREGLTRRDLGRLLTLATAGATLPFYNEQALAQDLRSIADIPPDAIRINANENPLGPCPEAREAAARVVEQGGRYQFNETRGFVAAMAESVGLPETHVLPFGGSSDPLHRSVLAFTSASKPLVTADPGYEAPERAAKFIGAKVVRVPLRPDFSHDAPAMAAADPDAGVIYICNPNNPTGTVTRKSDIDALIAKKPKGTIVVIDEAYIHFSASAVPAIDHILADRDVIVLRTFSKIYGLAGLRAGAALGRPDLLERLAGYGIGILPVVGLAAARASLGVKALVPDRRREAASVREDLFAWLAKKGYKFIPSEANMVMVDSGRPAKAFADAMLRHKVAIGRPWPTLPTHSRVTIGTRAEMAAFQAAMERVMA